jgi:hypothetical protein
MVGYCECKSLLAALTCLSLSYSPLTRASLSTSVKIKSLSQKVSKAELSLPRTTDNQRIVKAISLLAAYRGAT